MTELFLVRRNILLLIPDSEPTTEQSMDTSKVQLGEPVSFIGVSHRITDEGLLTGAEMTQRQLSPQLTPAWVTTHKS